MPVKNFEIRSMSGKDVSQKTSHLQVGRFLRHICSSYYLRYLRFVCFGLSKWPSCINELTWKYIRPTASAHFVCVSVDYIIVNAWIGIHVAVWKWTSRRRLAPLLQRLQFHVTALSLAYSDTFLSSLRQGGGHASMKFIDAMLSRW